MEDQGIQPNDGEKWSIRVDQTTALGIRAMAAISSRSLTAQVLVALREYLAQHWAETHRERKELSDEDVQQILKLAAGRK